MPAKKHKPEEIIGKLREVEIILGQGGTTAEACRRIAVSEQTYYRWRKEPRRCPPKPARSRRRDEVIGCPADILMDDGTHRRYYLTWM